MKGCFGAAQLIVSPVSEILRQVCGIQAFSDLTDHPAFTQSEHAGTRASGACIASPTHMPTAYLPSGQQYLCGDGNIMVVVQCDATTWPTVSKGVEHRRGTHVDVIVFAFTMDGSRSQCHG